MSLPNHSSLFYVQSFYFTIIRQSADRSAACSSCNIRIFRILMRHLSFIISWKHLFTLEYFMMNCQNNLIKNNLYQENECIKWNCRVNISYVAFAPTQKKMIVLVCTESYKNSYKLQLLKSKFESRARGTDLVRLRPWAASVHGGRAWIKSF